jgi:hypothetical protein
MKTILLLLICFSMIGCSSADNNGTTDWILKAHKPIICRSEIRGESGYRYWTLIDADGKVYASGSTTLLLPDTIKIIGEDQK